MFKADLLRDPHPIKQPEGSKATKNDLRYMQAATDTLMRLHMKVYGEEIMSLHTPKEWAQLEETFQCEPKKQRVTLLLDEPVAQFFRKKGRGYQALINQVLRTYAELRLARILEGPEDRGPEGEAL